ncbi:MAG: YcgN family cysteine cluster protein [Desulfobacterales bacterium]|jgi:uncharacterized cysteine cluster protein YcgN (CxxCxxCC family)
MRTKNKPFYEKLRFDEMTPEQWESLCDHCGLCCLRKFEDAQTGRIKYSGIACEFLDTETCQCLVYEDRHFINPECISLREEIVNQIKWLPETCAYRRLTEGKQLPRWHHLVSGDPATVHKARISARNKVVSGLYVHPDDLDNEF